MGLLVIKKWPVPHQGPGRVVSECRDRPEACLFSDGPPATPIFSESLRVQQVHYKKLYCIDVGLAQACIFGLMEKRGALLENLVYLHLRRRDGCEIYYYLTKSRQEIDFLAIRRGVSPAVIQVTDNVEHPATRQRETEALFQAMEELKIPKALLITKDSREEEMKRSGRTIKIVPFWEWSLEDYRRSPFQGRYRASFRAK